MHPICAYTHKNETNVNTQKCRFLQIVVTLKSLDHPVLSPNFIGRQKSLTKSADFYRSLDTHRFKRRLHGLYLSKITNDGLTWSGTGCFIAVPIWQQWALKG